MIADGYTGRKGKGGFYRLNRDKGKLKEAIDLASGAFRPARKPRIEAIEESGRSLQSLLEHDSPHGRYAWRVLGPTLSYAAMLAGDAADEISSIDEAMRLGYNWKFGPFELIDQLGPEWFTARLEAERHPRSRHPARRGWARHSTVSRRAAGRRSVSTAPIMISSAPKA